MMKIVKFADGTYGVRKGWFFGRTFVDLKSPNHSWSAGSSFFKDCKGTLEHARQTRLMRDASHEVIE